jgi:hypothetical protein
MPNIWVKFTWRRDNALRGFSCCSLEARYLGLWLRRDVLVDDVHLIEPPIER